MEQNSSPRPAQVIIVTGLSGSGKAVAIRQLEDSGYYCIDNLPGDFIVPVIESLSARGLGKIAISIDIRSRTRQADAVAHLRSLKERGFDIRVLFLTASTPALVQRFSETRRRHPLTPLDREPGDQTGLQEAIARERELISSDIGFVLDTSNLSSATLKAWIRQFVEAPAAEMTISFESFPFKKGIPVAADYVFDVRSLPNPYYVPELRPLTGKDLPVIEFLESKPEAGMMVDDIERFLRKWIPSYRNLGRHYLTVCIGCTGGQHRSVYVAEALYKRFSDTAGVVIRHRMLDKKTPPAEN